MVGYASDGEPVMAGQRGGLVSYFQANSDNFIYAIHCMAHRLELAIEKAMQKFPYFADFEKFINKLFQFYNWHNSKRKAHLKETVHKMKAKMYALNYVYHTRWISSELQSITNLKKMWKVLATDLNILSENRNFDSGTRDLANELFLKLKGRRFLAILHFISDILHHLSFWSVKMQERTALLVDFAEFNEKILATFENLRTTNGRDLNFLLMGARCEGGEDPCNNLDSFYDDNDLSYQDVVLFHDTSDVPLISDIRAPFLDEIITQIKSYFPNSNLKSFKIFLPKNMPGQIGEALTYGVIEINDLCGVFQMTDCLKLVSDWSNLLVSIIDSPNFCTIKTTNVETYAFWSQFLNTPGIVWTEKTTQLIQRILVLPIGSAEAERGFSIMNHIKTQRRSALTRNHVEDLMRIRINTVDDIEKFAAKKYAKEFIRKHHLRTDDPRWAKAVSVSLLEEGSKKKKFLPKLSFL